MQYIYLAINTKKWGVYVGKTKNLKRRIASHKHRAKTAPRSKFYNAVRKYGWEAFEFSIFLEVPDHEDINYFERQVIQTFAGEDCYNIMPGGDGGYEVKPENKTLWLQRLKTARAGRKPALGMQHNEDNRKLFSDVSKEWWATQPKYDIGDPWAISFIEANKKYGISKTHFYRLRKLGNEGRYSHRALKEAGLAGRPSWKKPHAQ